MLRVQEKLRVQKKAQIARNAQHSRNAQSLGKVQKKLRAKSSIKKLRAQEEFRKKIRAVLIIFFTLSS